MVSSLLLEKKKKIWNEWKKWDAVLIEPPTKIGSNLLIVIVLQANKEKISFSRLEVHEIAAFVLNSAGHYEAITRNCLNYYLSAESVALFADHIPCRPNYIVGQIVHIERQIVKSLLPTPTRPEHGRMDQAENLTSDTGTDRLTLNSGSTLNPYGLPIGCEYFLVTVAMLPDTTIHSPPPSWSLLQADRCDGRIKVYILSIAFIS